VRPPLVSSSTSASFRLRTEAELYRVAQEALANVRKHARATVVEIDLQASSALLELLVRDDGIGFDPARDADGGQGLIGMRERVDLLGGQLEVESQPGRGTNLRVRVPLEREAIP